MTSARSAVERGSGCNVKPSQSWVEPVDDDPDAASTIARLEQQLEDERRLAGAIAHDFNNILTAILGFARIVQDELPAGDPRRANVQAIEEAGERGIALVRQLRSG